MAETIASFIFITGIVQGVGFRPFVYNLAKNYRLRGWVRNTSAGVEIWVEGEPNEVNAFLTSLPQQIPPLARVDEIISQSIKPENHLEFLIRDSNPIPGSFQPISPDIATCPDCLKEMNDPRDRRYRYPFINCTNCGPRFTIIEDIPYDRSKTTMSSFAMCTKCSEEYHNPSDRRFHAQPVACPDCGPHIWLKAVGDSQIIAECDQAILVAQKLLSEGKIIAIKGLGGFHLACNANNPQSIALLRKRKLRVTKPFALMVPNTMCAEEICLVSDAERKLLESKERPIVILSRRIEKTNLSDISPNQTTLGIMLPYTPLHYLLLTPHPKADFKIANMLVMTSGNLSEEPIATTNEDALQRLSGLADAFLLHNRPIRTRCDDSVVRIGKAPEFGIHQLRRSRGYAPAPISLPWDLKPTLAFGAELKNTFCVGRGRYAFMSHHIGDLQNYETYQSFLDGIEHFQRLFHINPEILAHDLHPDYLSTRIAQEIAESRNILALPVQHHHAHIAACMVENQIPASETVLGAAFDGTGYGLDGAIWGGEFLLSTYTNFQRSYHIEYVPLPGGDTAIHKPARIALAYLWHFGLDWDPDYDSVQNICAEDQTFLRMQLQNHINSPLQSSMGRLFDAVASLIGICQKNSYEAQAAIELEAIVDINENGSYPIEFNPGRDEISIFNIIKGVVSDVEHRLSPSVISSRFHNTISLLVREVFVSMRNQYSVNSVVLSGGVWQNETLLDKTKSLLESSGFKCYTHKVVPPNDGGIALGQCIVAHHQQIK